MAEDNLKSAIEALLFASEKPVTIEQLRIALGSIEAPRIRAVLEELKNEYEQADRGLRLLEVAGGFRMATSPDFAPFLKKIYKGRHMEKLSKPALETLAIIAYKQPVTRLEIESFRSVNVDGVIKSLLEKNLIRIAGRKKAPGRPFVLGTTKLFLEHFGLRSLEELPKIEEFEALELKKEPGEIEAISEESTEASNEPREAA